MVCLFEFLRLSKSERNATTLDCKEKIISPNMRFGLMKYLFSFCFQLTKWSFRHFWNKDRIGNCCYCLCCVSSDILAAITKQFSEIYCIINCFYCLHAKFGLNNINLPRSLTYVRSNEAPLVRGFKDSITFGRNFLLLSNNQDPLMRVLQK